MEGIEAATRRRGAGAATLALRALLALALDALYCCFLAALWVCDASIAVYIAASRVFGEDSRAVIARMLLMAALPATMLLLFSVLLLRCFETQEIGGGGGVTRRPGTQRRRLERTGARAPPPECYGYAAASVVMVVFLLMQVFGPTKGSWQEKAGSAMIDTGCFIRSVMFCRFIFPKLLFQLRATNAKLKCGMVGW